MSQGRDHDLDSIVDAGRIGSRPSLDYLESVKVLDDVVRDCIFVSRSYSGLRCPSKQQFYASVLFTALITKGVSLLNLAPFSPWAEKKIEHWDYSSATGIVRTMLELRLAFYYLCVEHCAAEEWLCRWNIFNLHDCVSRKRLFQAMGKNNSGELSALEKQAEELRDRLRSNAFFAGFGQKEQRQILTGRNAYLFSREELAEKAGIDKDTCRWMYILFSVHVHGLPMSFYRIGGDNPERGRGVPSPIEEGYTSLCHSFATTLLTHTRDEVRELFKEFCERERHRATEANLTQSDEIKKDAFPVGASVDVAKSEDVRIHVVRRSEDVLDVLYYYPPTDELVLKRRISNDGAALEFFEPLFWTVLLNGRPATPKALDSVSGKDWAFKIDHNGRIIKIKVNE